VNEHVLTATEMQRVRDRLYEAAGIVLAPSKTQMVTARLSRRVTALKLPDLTAYLNHLDGPHGADEEQAFVNALTTNKTSFFREPEHFDVLAEQLSGHDPTRGEVRVWCAAASTGEEPWTLAMVLHRALAAQGARARILATDIDTDVLIRAERAVYPEECLEDVPAEHRDFFVRGRGEASGEVRVRRALRESVVFRQLNLRRPFPLRGGLEAIFCRNALIYFSLEDQIDTVRRLAALLSPTGRLYLGHSEGLVGVRAGLRSVGRCVFIDDHREAVARAG
jgi:chemotaxis protein methyltransferase CheR